MGYCQFNRMSSLKRLLVTTLKFSLLLTIAQVAFGQDGQPRDSRIVSSYDVAKDRTTVKLKPIKIGGPLNNFHSVHFAPAYSYAGTKPQLPEIIDFEVQTVVKGRLSTDLYVEFVIDGEKIFLSSNRSAIKRPVPGRRWPGERMIFRMPYETWLKLTRANTVEIRLGGTSFAVAESELKVLRDFADLIASNKAS